MPPPGDPEGLKTEELTAIIRAVRERVQARYPTPSTNSTDTNRIVPPLVDLLPLLHARDAAEAKVAAIGAVNPRHGGPVNALIQAVKRSISRSLDWFVRDQVIFNRETMACMQAIIEAMNDLNRSLLSLAEQSSARIDELRQELQQVTAPLLGEARELKEIRSHWPEWRAEWERKLSKNEMTFLRSVADLQGAFQHRATQMESNFRDMVKGQHADYLGALDRSTVDIQKKLWADMEHIRADYERLIHVELRLIRQRLQASEAGVVAAQPAAPAPADVSIPALDYARFAERFRGSEEFVQQQQRFYVEYFAGRQDVLDIGCGRGEFLGLMRGAGVPARGIDLSGESVDQCRDKGLNAERADLFAYLESLPMASLDGIFSAQVVEHLPPERLPEMIRLAASRLTRNGLLVIETPNPECLAIFATHFYLDPTHTRPVPHPLLAYYMQEYGLGEIQVHHRSPAIESIPALAELSEGMREALFGGLDYAIIGRKLS